MMSFAFWRPALLLSAMMLAAAGMAHAGDEFDLSPEQPARVHAVKNEAAIASIVSVG